ncbi:unnamed protein product [Blepharisma stoltei]|uniref:Uncharacterized protein n=1 Tax=Blepharisma stoltei TaxID=1481888 RepID=A0AAU9IR41_9CILI|nr:unnamed protein product [Blepharisma stoltei]
MPYQNADLLNEYVDMLDPNDQSKNERTDSKQDNAQLLPVSRYSEAREQNWSIQDFLEEDILIVRFYKLISFYTYIYKESCGHKFLVHPKGDISSCVQEFLKSNEIIDLRNLVVDSEWKIINLNKDDPSTADSTHQVQNLDRIFWPKLKIGTLLQKLLDKEAIIDHGKYFIIRDFKMFKNVTLISY